LKIERKGNLTGRKNMQAEREQSLKRKGRESTERGKPLEGIVEEKS